MEIEHQHLVEQHIINKDHPYFKDCDKYCLLSKNIANSVIYQYRQAVFAAKQTDTKIKHKSYETLNKEFIIAHNDDYYAMNTKISQQSIKTAVTEWFNWLRAIKAYWRDSSKFKAKPAMPGYKSSINGRKVVKFTPQAVARGPLLEQGFIRPTGTDWLLPYQNKGKKIQEVRIVPRSKHVYVVEIVYLAPPRGQVIPTTDGEVFIAGIDLGVNNLAAVAITSGKGFLFDGKSIKYINQLYNKVIAEATSKLEDKKHKSRYIENLWNRRSNRLKDILHKISTELVSLLHKEHVAKIIIGNNKDWKQDVNLGKRNNQNFVQIPFEKFISMITYKAKLLGIEVQVTEEAYTSQASSLDSDQLFCLGAKPDDYSFSGKRKGRNYISKDGVHLHADMNGAVNMIRKVISDPIGSWIRGCVVSPIKWSVSLG